MLVVYAEQHAMTRIAFPPLLTISFQYGAARLRRQRSCRIILEHVFAHMKKFRILSYRFRNPIGRYNLIIKNVAGLRNFVMA